MLIKQLRPALLAASAAVAGAGAAFATTMVQMSFEELVQEADVVIVGEASASRVERTSDGVVTVTTFNVEDQVLGAPSSSVEVVTPGGSFKPGKFRVQESTAETPLFPIGKEALLFLDPASGGRFAVVGFSQGAIEVNEQGATKTVRLPDSDKSESLPEAKSRIREQKNSGRRDRKDDSD